MSIQDIIKYSDLSEIVICSIYLETQFTNLGAHLFRVKHTINGTQFRPWPILAQHEFQKSSAKSETPRRQSHSDLPCRRRRAMKRLWSWWGRAGMNLQRRGPPSVPSRRLYEKPVPKGELDVQVRRLLLTIYPLEFWNYMAVGGSDFLPSFLIYSLSPYHRQSTVLHACESGLINSAFFHKCYENGSHFHCPPLSIPHIANPPRPSFPGRPVMWPQNLFQTSIRRVRMIQSGLNYEITDYMPTLKQGIELHFSCLSIFSIVTCFKPGWLYHLLPPWPHEGTAMLEVAWVGRGSPVLGVILHSQYNSPVSAFPTSKYL